MILLLLLAIFSIVAFLYYSKRARSGEIIPPGKQANLPLIERFILLCSKNIEKSILNAGKKYGPVVRMNMGLNQIMLINDASIIKEAGRSASLSGIPELVIIKFLKEKGMPTPDDGKEHRKFYLKNLKNFDFYGKSTEEKIQLEINEYNERIRAHGSHVFDVKRSFNVHTVNIIFSVLFGVRMKQNDQKFQEFLKSIKIYLEASNPLMWLCFVVPRLADWIPSFLSGKNFIEEFATSFVSLIERNMEVYLESRVQNQPRNYTDALMDKIEATTDETSVFHSSQNTWVPFFIDVLLAAIETTSSTLEWSSLFLSQFPEVQKRLQAEIDEVIGNVKCPVGSDRDKMPDFQAVLEEVFRLAPPLPFGFHKCTEDTKLMGVDIKKNSLIVLNFFGYHIDPDKWEDPDIFKPERFLDGDQNFVKPELFTFGYGRRSCIGEHVARSQLFIFLTSILQSFNIYPQKKLVNLRGNLTIGYRCVECKVIFEPRDKVKSD